MRVEEWLGKDNQLGIDIWNKKYRYNNETFDEWLDRVSAGNTNIKEMIVNKEFLFGGRVLSNRGVDKKATYSNCYVLSAPEDNLESIFKTCSNMARTFSYGGGVGFDISKLRPRGATVNNTAKQTSGAVSFMDLFSMVTGIIGQNGRRGALMLSMSVDHPDIMEFIDVKTDVERVTKANISIRVTDKFMKAVENNEDWKLTFTVEETGQKISKVVKARDILHKLAENNWSYGEPGVLFWDTISNNHLMSENDMFKYAGTNPCFHKDTLILTDKGYIPIKELANKNCKVWNGYEFSEVVPTKTGENQHCFKITFSNGCELVVTDYHKFVLKDGERVEAKNLNVGDKLIKWKTPVIDGYLNLDDGWKYGFFCGDGYSSNGRNRITLYGAKKDLFDGKSIVECPKTWHKCFVPDTKYTVASRKEFLAGLIDSDGTKNSEDGSISITSVNKEFLNNVRRLIETIGGKCTISLTKKECDRPLPNGKGGYNIYHCKDCYRLTISAYYVEQLNLPLRRVDVHHHTNRNAERFISVTSIEEYGTVDCVYCMNEPKNHSVFADGVITANCGEMPLPEGGACNLGSLNLSAFVREPFTKKAYIDYDRLNVCVRNAIWALNDLLDEGLPRHPLAYQRISVARWRQIGLGYMGLADMLIKLGIEYGSTEAVKIVDDVLSHCAKIALMFSESYAIAKGIELRVDFNKIKESDFYRRLGKSVNTLANSQLLTIAPTGTLSTMLGISGGIEPIFANSYTRKTESLNGEDTYYKVYTPIVKEYMELTGITNDEDLPNYFVTAHEIDYEKRIDMQATAQKWIDGAISSTINLPNSATVEDVENAYEYAWRKGCKGVTVFRDGCARSGVLITNEPKEKPTETKDHELIGLKRKIVTGCGNLHINAYFDKVTGELKETFLSKGSCGGCNNFMIGLSRMLSLACRNGATTEEVVDQLKSSGVCPSYAVRKATKNDTSIGSSCPVAIGYALLEMQSEIDSGKFTTNVDVDCKKEVCPECGEPLEHEGGCDICKACGYSKCS